MDLYLAARKKQMGNVMQFFIRSDTRGNKSECLTLNVESHAGAFGRNQGRMTSFTNVVGFIVVRLGSNSQLGSGVESTRQFSIGGGVLYPF